MMDAEVISSFEDYVNGKTWKRDTEVGDFEQEHERKGNQFYDKLDKG